MKSIIALSLTAILLFSSCADVPDTVRDRAENSSVTDSLESKADSDLVFDTVENATKNAASVLGNKYQNIVLPESIDIPAANRAYTMSASRYADEGAVDTEELLKEFAQIYVGEEPEFIFPQGLETVEVAEASLKYKGIPPEDYDKYIDYEALEREKEKEIYDPDKSLAGTSIGKFHLEMFSGGTFYGYKVSDWIYRLSNDYASYVYDLRNDDIEGVSFKVAEEDYPLTDALRLAEDFVRNDLMPIMKNDTDVKARAIYVYENFGIEGDENTRGYSEGNYRYIITFDHIIDGLPLSKAGSGQTREEHMAGSDFTVTIAVPGEISEVGNKMYPYVREKQECEKIITLESALAHAEKVLAPFETYNVKEISLEYCAVEEGVTGYQPNTSFEYRPMWCLVVAKYPAHYWYQPELRRVLYIDALDGTVRLWDDSTESLLFGGGS